jgi:hypothetical protein
MMSEENNKLNYSPAAATAMAATKIATDGTMIAESFFLNLGDDDEEEDNVSLGFVEDEFRFPPRDADGNLIDDEVSHRPAQRPSFIKRPVCSCSVAAGKQHRHCHKPVSVESFLSLHLEQQQSSSPRLGALRSCWHYMTDDEFEDALLQPVIILRELEKIHRLN